MYISIADMIEFMVGESQQIIWGNNHEDDWFALPWRAAVPTDRNSHDRLTEGTGLFATGVAPSQPA